MLDGIAHVLTAVALIAWALVALDAARRYIAYRADAVRSDEQLAALQATAERNGKAIENMARHWAEALAKEQARMTAVEAKLTAGDVRRGAQAGNWRGQ